MIKCPRWLALLLPLSLLLGCEKKETSLYLYCGAGLRPAVSEVVEAFTAETGVKVVCDYAGSGVLISRIRASRRGDFYLPGDVRWVELAEKEGLIEWKRTVCYFVPVILVRRGNPEGIKGVKDLARPGIRLALGNPEACAIGEITRQIFRKSGVDLKAVERNLAFSGLAVNELGLQVKAGKADAAIVWDAIAAYYADSCEAIPIPPSRNVISHVAIGVLKFSQNKELARKFVNFLTGERGKAIFKKHHYTVSLPKGFEGG